MKINPNIFRTYDIRGIYPREINEDSAYLVARAFATYSNASRIPLAYDMRESSKPLKESVICGLTDSGVETIDIGMMPTPVLNFTVAKNKFRAGIIITASHNPREYNGLKLIGEKAIQLNRFSGIEEVKRIALNKNFIKGKGRLSKKNYLNQYLEEIVPFTKNIKGLKIVIDFGNGMGAVSAMPLYEKMPIEFITLYQKPDGSYPNHQANPAEEQNLEDLKDEIKKQKADLGIAFDGDADRAFFVDEKGTTARPDHLTAAFALHELARTINKKVYFDLRFSKIVPKLIKEMGGKPIRMRVGNPFYKEKLIQKGGAFAAEMSGHFMFSQFYGIDDGLLASLKIMQMICKERKSLSEILKQYQKDFFQSGEINIETEKSEQIIKELKKKFKKGKLDHLDGITIEMTDFWFNLRASNTEPIIRLNIEANSKKILEQKTKEILDIIKNVSGKETK